MAMLRSIARGVLALGQASIRGLLAGACVVCCFRREVASFFAAAPISNQNSPTTTQYPRSWRCLVLASAQLGSISHQCTPRRARLGRRAPRDFGLLWAVAAAQGLAAVARCRRRNRPVRAVLGSARRRIRRGLQPAVIAVATVMRCPVAVMPVGIVSVAVSVVRHGASAVP